MTPPQEAATAAPRPSRQAHGEAPNGRAEPSTLPPGARLDRLELPSGETLELLLITVADEGSATGAEDDGARQAAVAGGWVARVADAPVAAPARPSPSSPTPSLVTIPLYGCHVVWAPGRAAVVGPAAKLELLEAAVVEFAEREAVLREAERRTTALLDGLEGDAAVAFAIDERPVARQPAIAERYRETVAVRRRLALLAPAIHAAPVHPPTLASQLGERLRDRARLVERHELANDRADLAERVCETCGQRAADVAIARRQLALEWAIVVLLVAQTALLIVELLGRRGTP